MTISLIQDNAAPGLICRAITRSRAMRPIHWPRFRDRFDIAGRSDLSRRKFAWPVLPKGRGRTRWLNQSPTEWGKGLIRSWNAAGWMPTCHAHVGARIAPSDRCPSHDCVVAADSTTVNLFKVVSAALSLRPERTGHRYRDA